MYPTKYLIIVTMMFTTISLGAQVWQDSTLLPIIFVSTDADEIEDNPKLFARISVLDKADGSYNKFSDSLRTYSGYCGIELRGESSLWFKKKSYDIEMWDSLGIDIDTNFLDFKSEEDFILYGPYSDKSLFNNVLAMKLAREMGEYASPTKFVELVVNNDYKGLYVLMEKIKRDKNRLDIAKLLPTDNSGDELTGGYIVRIDKGDTDGWTSNFEVYGDTSKVFFQYYYPNEEEITQPQMDYIQSYFSDFEDAVANSDGVNSNGLHYSQYISLRSFVDNLIINELSKNADGYRLSSYFYKEKDSNGGRLHAGPVWDYNLSFGNCDYCGTDIPEDWLYYNCVGYSPFWWNVFMEDPFFQQALRCRWESLREDILSEEFLHTFLDTMSTKIEAPQERNFERWPIMGMHIWPNPTFLYESQSHSEVVDKVKVWLTRRLEWMDNNLPGEAFDCDKYNDTDYDITSSIDLNPRETIIKISPNPTQKNITISSEFTISHVVIRDLLGRTFIDKESFSAKEVDLNLIHLPNGSYSVSVFSNSKTQTLLLIKI